MVSSKPRNCCKVKKRKEKYKGNEFKVSGVGGCALGFLGVGALFRMATAPASMGTPPYR